MSTTFPYLSDRLEVKKSQKYPDISWWCDRITIRTRDFLAGILLMSELYEDNPDLNGKMSGRLATHREDVLHWIDFRIYGPDRIHLIDIDFTMDTGRYGDKLRWKHWVDNKVKKIALINGSLLLWIAHWAEEICYLNPKISKREIIETIPTLKKSKNRVVIALS